MKKIVAEGETVRSALRNLSNMIDEEVGEGLTLSIEIKPARVKDWWNHVDVAGFSVTAVLP